MSESYLGDVAMSPLAFISLPNPFDLLGAGLSELLDLGASAVGEVAGSLLGNVLGELNGAVIGALVDMVAAILEFFWVASEPELTSRWFYGDRDAPYHQMVLFAMPLLVVFVFAGIIQGVLKGDTAGMLRMVLARLPGAVLAMSIAVVLADLLIKITDDMSRAVLAGFREDIEQVGTVLMALRLDPNTGAASLLLLLVFGLIGLLAAVVLVVQLFVRGSLIYLIAAFSPLVFAASVWEPMRGAVRKLCEITVALIVSKLAIAVALAVSAAALVGSWPGEVSETEIPTPELTAAQLEQSHTQSIGILLSSVVMFVVAAFMPWVVWRLMPFAESALVAQGVQGGPLRAFHSVSATANSLRYNPASSALRSAAHAARRRGKGREGGDKEDGKGGRGTDPATKPVRHIPNFDDPAPPRPGTTTKKTPRRGPSNPKSGQGSPPRPGSPSPQPGRRIGPAPQSGGARKPGGAGPQPGARRSGGAGRPRRSPPGPKGRS